MSKCRLLSFSVNSDRASCNWWHSLVELHVQTKWRTQKGPSLLGQPFAHFPLFVYVDPVNIITSQRLFHSCRKANTFERSHGLLATPVQDMQPLSVRVLRASDVPGEKKRRPGQQERSGGLFGSCCATLTFLRRAVSLQTASHLQHHPALRC